MSLLKSRTWKATALLGLPVLVIAGGLPATALALDCTHYATSSANPAAGGDDGTSIDTPWTLPEAIAQTGSNKALEPGNVVCLDASYDYETSINPHAGSSAPNARLSFQNHPGMARPRFVDEACLSISETDWIRIAGIHCTGFNKAASNPTKGPHNTAKAGRIVRSHNIVEDSIFEYFAKSGLFISGDYNQIRNNVIRYVGNWNCPGCPGSGDNVELVGAVGTLFEGNLVEYSVHIPFGVADSPGTIVRDNVFRNPWFRSDMDNGWEGDQVLIGWTPGGATDRIVFDGNVVRDMGAEADLSAASRDFSFGIGSPQTIARHNVIVHNEIAGLKINTANLVPESWGSKIYHNVIVDNGFHGVSITEGGNGSNDASGNDIRNNVIAYNGRTIDYQPFNPNSVLSSASVQAHLYSMNNVINAPGVLNPTTELDGNQFSNNDVVDGDCGEVGGICQTATYTPVFGAAVVSVEDPVFGTRTQQTLVQAAEDDTNWRPNFDGNLALAPGFEDEAGDDFALGSTSALIDAGAPLTQTVACDAALRTVVVEDAGFFSAGLVDPVSLEVYVSGDLIRVGADVSKIEQLDYTTNTFTLTVGRACAAGEDVSLSFTGTAPDVGYRDFDGDGVIDPRDNCPTIASNNFADGDNDGIGDLCDVPAVPAMGISGRIALGLLLLAVARRTR